MEDTAEYSIPLPLTMYDTEKLTYKQEVETTPQQEPGERAISSSYLSLIRHFFDLETGNGEEKKSNNISKSTSKHHHNHKHKEHKPGCPQHGKEHAHTHPKCSKHQSSNAGKEKVKEGKQPPHGDNCRKQKKHHHHNHSQKDNRHSCQNCAKTKKQERVKNMTKLFFSCLIVIISLFAFSLMILFTLSFLDKFNSNLELIHDATSPATTSTPIEENEFLVNNDNTTMTPLNLVMSTYGHEFMIYPDGYEMSVRKWLNWTEVTDGEHVTVLGSTSYLIEFESVQITLFKEGQDLSYSNVTWWGEQKNGFYFLHYILNSSAYPWNNGSSIETPTPGTLVTQAVSVLIEYQLQLPWCSFDNLLEQFQTGFELDWITSTIQVQQELKLFSSANPKIPFFITIQNNSFLYSDYYPNSEITKYHFTGPGSYLPVDYADQIKIQGNLPTAQTDEIGSIYPCISGTFRNFTAYKEELNATGRDMGQCSYVCIPKLSREEYFWGSWTRPSMRAILACIILYVILGTCVCLSPCFTNQDIADYYNIKRGIPDPASASGPPLASPPPSTIPPSASISTSSTHSADSPVFVRIHQTQTKPPSPTIPMTTSQPFLPPPPPRPASPPLPPPPTTPPTTTTHQVHNHDFNSITTTMTMVIPSAPFPSTEDDEIPPPPPYPYPSTSEIEMKEFHRNHRRYDEEEGIPSIESATPFKNVSAPQQQHNGDGLEGESLSVPGMTDHRHSSEEGRPLSTSISQGPVRQENGHERAVENNGLRPLKPTDLPSQTPRYLWLFVCTSFFLMIWMTVFMSQASQTNQYTPTYDVTSYSVCLAILLILNFFNVIPLTIAAIACWKCCNAGHHIGLGGYGGGGNPGGGWNFYFDGNSFNGCCHHGGGGSCGGDCSCCRCDNCGCGCCEAIWGFFKHCFDGFGHCCGCGGGGGICGGGGCCDGGLCSGGSCSCDNFDACCNHCCNTVCNGCNNCCESSCSGLESCCNSCGNCDCCQHCGACGECCQHCGPLCEACGSALGACNC